MSLPYTDGVILPRSFATEIDGVKYIFNNMNWDVPTLEVTRNGINGTVKGTPGNPGGMRLEEERITGTGEIQVNTTAQIKDLRGVEFEIPDGSDPDDGDDSRPVPEDLVFVIRSMGPSIQSGNARTASIDVVEVVNPDVS